jgi:hypothetical protein
MKNELGRFGMGNWECGKRAESSLEKLPSDFTGQAMLKTGDRGQNRN